MKHIVVTGDIVPKICYIMFVINKIGFSFSKKKKKKIGEGQVCKLHIFKVFINVLLEFYFKVIYY